MKADPSLFVCEDAPAVPAKLTDKSRAGYTVGLYGAWKDCKSKLSAAGEVASGPSNP